MGRQFPEGGEVNVEVFEGTVDDMFSNFPALFRRKTNVDEVELGNIISAVLFLLRLVGVMKRASGHSLEVATRALSASSEIYSPSAPSQFAVGTGAFRSATGMGVRCTFGRTGSIEENPPAKQRQATDHQWGRPMRRATELLFLERQANLQKRKTCLCLCPIGPAPSGACALALVVVILVLAALVWRRAVLSPAF